MNVKPHGERSREDGSFGRQRVEEATSEALIREYMTEPNLIDKFFLNAIAPASFV